MTTSSSLIPLQVVAREDGASKEKGESTYLSGDLEERATMAAV